MLLSPRDFKYKKRQKGKKFNKLDNIITFQNINFNTIKLVSLSSSRLKSKQINSIFMLLNKSLKKNWTY